MLNWLFRDSLFCTGAYATLQEIFVDVTPVKFSHFPTKYSSNGAIYCPFSVTVVTEEVLEHDGGHEGQDQGVRAMQALGAVSKEHADAPHQRPTISSSMNSMLFALSL